MRLLTPSERRSMERVTREIHAEAAELLKDYQPLWMWELPHCDSAGNVAPGVVRKMRKQRDQQRARLTFWLGIEAEDVE